MPVIGTRGSKLALTQSEWVRREIVRHAPGADVELRVITTSADRDQDTPIRTGAGRGVFVREIDDALLAGDIDLAVHSMKDVPTLLPGGIELAAVPAREDARDALLSRQKGTTVETLPKGARIGTGSVRRRAQLLALRPDLRVEEIRGNVDTRIRKLDEGSYDAIILACAGLRRLGLERRITYPLEIDAMVPAPGQGALALAARAGDAAVRSLLEPLHDPAAAAAVEAERAFLERIGGGCNSPVAVHARVDSGQMQIVALVATPDGEHLLRDSVVVPVASAAAAARALAESMLSSGGIEILARLS